MLKNTADNLARADKFISDLIENQTVYYMLHPEGGAFVCMSTEFLIGEEPAPVVPVWSKKYLPYAKKFGEGLEIGELSIDEFIHSMLPAMIEDNVLIGLNWDQKGSGTEVEPLSLYEKIQSHVSDSES